MESLLSQSKRLCPFLKKTSPTTLRALSTSAAASNAALVPTSGPVGGAMSNLQVIARRCPVMSKALAVQSVRLGMGPRRVPPSQQQRRSYVHQSAPMGLRPSGKKAAEEANLKEVHLKHGVLDTSKGKQQTPISCPF